MKVLITSEWYKPVINGVVTSVLNLKEELEKAGHEVKVLTLSADSHSHKDGNDYYIRSLSMDRVYPNARMSLCFRHPFFKEIIDWKPDVIHSQCELTTFMYARHIAKVTGAPIVHTYHTVYEDYTHYFSPNKTVGKVMARMLTRTLLSHTDLVIAPTKKVEDLLISYRIEPTVLTIPTGIDLKHLDVEDAEAKRAAIRAQLGIGQDEKMLIIIGRLAKEKNVEEIFGFLSHRPQQRCILVGGGPYKDVLEKKARDLGIYNQIIFTGMIEPAKIGTYYRVGDVFVSASNSETQGLTYIEALACGRPAVCKKDDCLYGVIENGVNGWQFETEEEFWKAIDTLFADDAVYEEASRQATASMKKFSKEIFGEKVAQCYEEVIAHFDPEKRRMDDIAWEEDFGIQNPDELEPDEEEKAFLTDIWDT